MQGKAKDVVTALNLIWSCRDYIVQYRNTGYEDALSKAKEIAEIMDIEPEFEAAPRMHRKKCLFSYEGADESSANPKEMFKRDFFYQLVDTARVSVDECFQQMSEFVDLWGFLYNLSAFSDRNTLMQHCKDLHIALTEGEMGDIDGIDLCEKLGYLQHLLPKNCNDPKDIFQFIANHDVRDNFPNTWISIRILLTLPVTVASGERSFSKLKLIKIYLRSAMGDDRLSSVAILSIENVLARKLDLSDTLKEFASLKARKVPS